jgi:hypothetical protein
MQHMLLLLWIAIALLVVIGAFMLHPILGVLAILIPVALIWTGLKR